MLLPDKWVNLTILDKCNSASLRNLDSLKNLQVITVIQTDENAVWRKGRHLIPHSTHIYLPENFDKEKIDEYLDTHIWQTR